MKPPTATLIILPGLDGTGILTEPFANGNWGRWPVKVLPLPKTGPQDYPSLVKLLSEQLPKGKLVIVGESFSSPLAMLLAEQEKARTTALVIAGGFCAPPISSALGLLPMKPLFLIRPPATALRKFLAEPHTSDESIAALTAAIRQVPAATLAARVQVVLALKESDCPAPEIPTLILQARHDGMIPWESQSRLERHFQNATVAWIESPHLLFALRPEACREAVLDFLAGLTA